MHEIFSIFKNSYIYLSMPYSSFFKLFSDFLLKNRAILVCFSLIFWVSAFLINSLFSCKNPHSAALAMVNGWKIPDNSGHPNYLFCVPSLVILWGFMILPIIFPHCHYSLYYYYMGLVTTMKKMHCTTSNHVKCTTIFAFPMSYSQNWTKSHLRFLKFHRFKNHIVWGKL